MSLKVLRKINQHDGFDCPGCAWPDPDRERSIVEFCENGAKAVAEEATDAGDPWVSITLDWDRYRVALSHHSAEFEHHKLTATISNTVLPIENRASSVEKNYERDQCHDRPEHHEQYDRGQDVNESLHDEISAIQFGRPIDEALLKIESP